MVHPLSEFLRSKGLHQQDMAKLSGVAQYTISRVINGKTHAFSPRDAERIFKATHGALTIEQLRMPVPPPRRRRRAA